MREVSDEILNNCNKQELLSLKKNITDYIVDLDIDKINWKSITKEEMKKFISNNYCFDNKYINWDNSESIFGMHYLRYYLYSDKYFIGTIKNNIGKETIVGCIGYDTYHEILGNVNYISTVEINYFYQENGLLKIMYDEFVKLLDLNKDIFITNESLMGKEFHVIDNLKRVLKRNNFEKEIYIDE